MLTPSHVIGEKLEGRTYREVAEELGCSAGHLHHIRHGKKEANEELLDRLGLERVVRVTYRRKRNGTN